MVLGVIDYRLGNIASVMNSLNALDSKCKIKLISNTRDLKSCDKIIMPGVGAFINAMQNIESIREGVLDFAKSGKYILGICLGMQILFEKSSEFGECQGLGLLEGDIVSFYDNDKFDKKLKIPHMGWNLLRYEKDHPLLHGITSNFYLYFVHSFYANCSDDLAIAKSNYGIPFPAIVGKDNILGIQCHPEKSQILGLQIIRNFINL